MLRPLARFIALAGFAVALHATPCVPGTLQEYYNLPIAGCEVGAVTVSGFSAAPIQPIATLIDPTLIQVTPGGGASSLLFTLGATAGSGIVLESFFSFSAAGSLFDAAIGLVSPSATGDGAVTGILDICPDASFLPDEPTGCATTADTAIVFAIEGDQLLQESISFPPSTFFDVFVDLTVDGGLGGSAGLDSATVEFNLVPEPATAALLALGLGALAAIKRRR